VLRGRLAGQRGQAFVLAAVGIVAILGMAGFAIDVGVWYQAHRKQQAIADAAALAAANDLPASTGQATSDASTYAQKNAGTTPAVAFSTTYTANDTVTVTTSATAPSYFLKVLGFGDTNVGATATATAVPLGAAYGSAPFAVYYTQPELSGNGCPCYDVPTTLNFNQVGPGGFEIINVDGSSSPNGGSTLADWITNGCSCTMTAPVWLWGDPGAKFNSAPIGTALDGKIGKVLLFPVYDQNRANGSNMQYHIIAFVGFKITGYKFNGNNGTITGSFEKVSWKGSGASSSPGAYSATTVQLTG
jgi:Flp pilus assembly protein TadG